MSRSITGAVLLMALTVALVVTRKSDSPQEPECRGLPLSRWLHQLSYGAPAEAGAALRDMGSTAVPFLLHRLRRNEISSAQRAYAVLHSHLPVLLHRYCPAPRYRDDELPDKIAVALSHAAPIADLLDALDDSSPDVRVAAVNALRMSSPSERDRIVPALVLLEKDPDERVRAGAAAAIEALSARP